jgi:hypothetical protein
MKFSVGNGVKRCKTVFMLLFFFNKGCYFNSQIVAFNVPRNERGDVELKQQYFLQLK